MSIINELFKKLSGNVKPKKRAKNISELQRKIGYKFNDLNLLELAMRHRSYVHELKMTNLQSNERLEFLGDSVIGLVINEFLYKKFTRYSDGQLAKLKSILASGVVLSEVAEKIKLGDYIFLSGNEEKLGGRHKSSLLADTYEAVIGAVYLDGGLEAARNMIDKTFLNNYKSFIKSHRINYKSELQEYTQKADGSYPIYKVERTEGPDHDRIFYIQVYWNDKLLAVGKGKNKKEAEQNAAKLALEKLKKK